MATVTSQLTRISDVEGAVTSVSIGGGSGATVNTDVFIQGAQSLARRQSNVTLGGFLLDDGVGSDLSAAGVHVGVWAWVTHFAVLTELRVRIASASGSGNFDDHSVPLTEYPSLGGWIRVWLDISRVPEAVGGSALDEASARYFGLAVSIPSVGGNAQNLVLDAVDSTTSGLFLTGTAGAFADFIAADTDGTNRYGVISTLSGVVFCRARLTLGSASSLAFSDSNFAIVFPQQALVAPDFMGITCDLQNAATDITLASGTMSAPGAVKGDFVVTGTAGSLTLSGVVFSGLRIVTLTSGVAPTNCTFDGCGLIAAGGATLTSCTISNSVGASGISVANLSQLDKCTLISSGTGHAVDLGTVAASTTMTWDNTGTGYAATNGATGNETILVNVAAGQTLTVNVAAGATTPTYRNTGAGAVSVVAGQVTLTVAVLDILDGLPIEGARVYVVADSGGGLTPGTVIIDKVVTDASGLVSDTRSYSSNQPITGVVRKGSAATFYKSTPVAGTVNNASGLSLTIQMIPDA